MARALPLRALTGVLIACVFPLAGGCGGTIGYALRPETIKNCRPQSIRLAIATFEDGRPLEEKDYDERVRLVGDAEAKGYTKFGDGGVSDKVATALVKHLAFAGCFNVIGRVDLRSDEQVDFLKADIKKQSADYDAVLIGSVTHLWGFDGTTAGGDRRVVEGQAQLVDLKIIRTRDLKMIWSGAANANFREVESQYRGNEYRIANDMLRDATNKLSQDLSKARLTAR
jgi:hypothetical protein